MNAAGYFDAATWRVDYLRTLSQTQQKAFIYLEKRLERGRDYVSLARMAKALNITEDQCDNALVRFRVDRSLPIIIVLEEMEG